MYIDVIFICDRKERNWDISQHVLGKGEWW